MARRRIVDLFRTCEYSDEEIAEITGCGRHIVYSVVKETLLPTERRELMKRRAWIRRKYHYAPDLFAAPLSDDELWLFGLLMADGSMADRRVDLNLSACDRDALEAARRVAGSNAPIRRREAPAVNPWGSRPTVWWSIHSREVVSRVVALGMVPAKSRRDDVHVPEVVAKSPHFWRGLIDGDGTVGWSSGYPFLQVLGGRLLLAQWGSFVVAHTRGRPPKIRPKTGTKLLHQSSLTGWRAWKMLGVIYGQGGPALERKRQTTLEILACKPPVCRGAITAGVAKRALDALGDRPLREVRQSYVCSQTGVRLGKLLKRARRGGRADLHSLFERYDADWRTASSGSVPSELAKRALDALGERPLREVSQSYVCPETGLQLGKLLERARRGLRPDLHQLFDRYDRDWRTARPGNFVRTELVNRALDALGDRPLREVSQSYVCPRTGVRLGALLSRARRGLRPDLHSLFGSRDPRWRG